MFEQQSFPRADGIFAVEASIRKRLGKTVLTICASASDIDVDIVALTRNVTVAIRCLPKASVGAAERCVVATS